MPPDEPPSGQPRGAADAGERLRSSRHILLCLRYGIGDVIMETAIIDALRMAAPRARITAVGAPPAIQLVHRDPCVDQVVGVDRWNLTHWYDHGTRRAREGIARWLDAQGFDLFLDVSHAVLALREVIRQRDNTPVLDTHAETEHEALVNGHPGQHAIHAGTQAGWGIPIPPGARPRLFVGVEDTLFADRFLDRHGLRGAPLAALSVEASSRLKRWPLKHFARVLEALLARGGWNVLLIAAPGDTYTPRMLEMVPNRHKAILLQTHELRKVAALVKRCAALLCNDTGLMHMASAVGTPVTALFGPTWPQIYLPIHCHAHALGGWEIPCPYRHTTLFGPPLCIAVDRCLNGRDGCINAGSAEEVTGDFLDAIQVGMQQKGEESHAEPFD